MYFTGREGMWLEECGGVAFPDSLALHGIGASLGSREQRPGILYRTGQGGAAAHWTTHDCLAGGSEPDFQSPQSGISWRKHSITDFYGVGTLPSKALACKPVAMTVGNHLFPYSDIQ